MPSRYGGLDFPALASGFKLPCLCWQPSVEELVHSISHCWNRVIHLGTFSFFFQAVLLRKLRSHTHSLHLIDPRSSKFLSQAFPSQFSFFAETSPVEMELWGASAFCFLAPLLRLVLTSGVSTCLVSRFSQSYHVLQLFQLFSLLLKGINNLSSFLIHGNYFQFIGMRRSLRCSSLPKKI